jgi:hypothetical protein
MFGTGSNTSLDKMEGKKWWRGVMDKRKWPNTTYLTQKLYTNAL